MNVENKSDLIVFSLAHFGCDTIRTSKLMTEFAQHRRVYFIEAAIIGVSATPTYYLKQNSVGVTIIQPHLPAETSVFEQKNFMMEILKELINDEHLCHYTVWMDTPKAMPFIRTLSPEIIIYDCVKNFSQTNPDLEKELFAYADVVLTSGMSVEADKIDDLHYFTQNIPASFHTHA